MTNLNDCSVNLYAYYYKDTYKLVYSIINLSMDEMDELDLEPALLPDAQDACMWAEDVQIMLDDMLKMMPGHTRSSSLEYLIAMLREIKARNEGYEVSPSKSSSLLYKNFNLYDLNKPNK